MRAINQNDINTAAYQNQQIISGTSEEDKSIGIYFIFQASGASTANPVTIKDKDSNTVIILNTPDSLHYPIILQDGFEFTSGSTAYIVFGKIAE